MSKVINTATHGDLLTSKMNAHSLTVGDVVVIDLDLDGIMVPLRVVRHEIRIRLQQVMIMFLDLRNGLPVPYIAEINQPMDRVTGARSAGQI